MRVCIEWEERGHDTSSQSHTLHESPASATPPAPEILSLKPQKKAVMHGIIQHSGERDNKIKRRNRLCYDVMQRCDDGADGQSSPFSLFLSYKQTRSRSHAKHAKRDAQI